MTFKEMLNLDFEEFIGKLCDVEYQDKGIHKQDMLIIDIFNKAKERRSITRWEYEILKLMLVTFNQI